MNDVSSMPPMVPSARDRIDAVYEQWNDVTDIHTDIEDLHIAAMDRAYLDGWNTAQAEIARLKGEVEDWRGRLATQCGKTLASQIVSSQRKEMEKLAEEYKGRADDAGRLARMVLAKRLDPE